MSATEITCEEMQTHLMSYLSERLDGRLSDQVQNHLDDCLACCDRLERLVANPNQWSALRAVHSEFDWPRDSDEGALSILSPSDDPASLGRIGPLEVTGLIGRGGMGIVYKAHDRSLDRTVAVKVLEPTLGHSERSRHRFAREARAMAAVSHPHVVPVHAVDNHGQLPYLVMEYVPGGTLAKRIGSSGSLDVVSTLRVALQVASALDAAHGQGLVHRDVKPSNLLLDPGVEKIRVADFGLAQVTDGSLRTLSGTFVGTPAYMSPEQFRGQDVDGRSDLFGLGCVMYEMLTGTRPFEAETLPETMRNVLEIEPPPPSQCFQGISERSSMIPDWLDALVIKLLAKNPEERFASASELETVLRIELVFLQSDDTQSPTPNRSWLTQPSRYQRLRSNRGWKRRIAIVCLAGGLLWFLYPGRDVGQPGGPEMSPTPPVSQAAAQVVQMPTDSEAMTLDVDSLDEPERALVEKLIEATNHKQVAFALNNDLMRLPPDSALRVARFAWPRLQNSSTKTGVLKAFQFGHHRHIASVLDLGMTDADPDVREYANFYLINVAMEDFSSDPTEYTRWVQFAKDATLEATFQRQYERLVNKLTPMPVSQAISHYESMDDDMGGQAVKSSYAAKRSAAAESGLHDLILRWHDDPEITSEEKRLVRKWIAIMTPSESMVNEQLRPMLNATGDGELRLALVRAIDRASDEQLTSDEQPTSDDGITFAQQEYLRQLETLVRAESDGTANQDMDWKAHEMNLKLTMMRDASPAMIPRLIAIMDCDNSKDTISTIKSVLGAIPIPNQSGRTIDVPEHMTDGPWWRRWWIENRECFGEPLAGTDVPELPKTKHGQSYVPLPEDIGTYEVAAEMIRAEMAKPIPDYDVIRRAAFGVLDPRVIPILIGVIESDNSYDTVYGIGYFGIGYMQRPTLTQVRYSPYHDGPWWRRWWNENRQRVLAESGLTLADDPGIPTFAKSEHGKTYQPYPDDLDTHEGRVKYVRSCWGRDDVELKSLIELIASFDEPKGIPLLIGMLQSHSTKAGNRFRDDQANYVFQADGFCDNAIGELTQVERRYDELHDAAWWTAWWDRNRGRFPTAKDEPIPTFGG